MTGVFAVEKNLDDASRHDGNLNLSKGLMTVVVAQNDKEKIVNGHQQQEKNSNTRKLDHQAGMKKLSQPSSKSN